MSSDPEADLSYIENRLFDEIELGDSASLRHRLTVSDFGAFAVVPPQAKPAQSEGIQSEGANAGKMTAHGMWAGELFADILSTRLPGPGTICLKQSLSFHEPAVLDETVDIRVAVAAKDSVSKHVTLDCVCTDKDGQTLVSGRAVVIPPMSKMRRPRATKPEMAVHETGAVHRRLLAAAQAAPALPTAVVHPCDAASLQAALSTSDLGLIAPVLVGPAARIAAAAQEIGRDLAGFEVVDTPHSHASAERAVALVRDGRARALMKGALHTDEVMSAVVAKETGLRSERRMSHIYVLDVPTYPKPLLITDAAINIAPDLQSKADIVQNAIDLARAIGIDRPKVALLSAVETITPRLQSTVEAGALCKMADRGQISGGVLDGPLAFDNAISMGAAARKGITSDVAGQADVLMAPDLEAGNMIAKQLMYLAGAEGAGIVLGAQVPIILTSRADDARTRIASAAIAVLFSEAEMRP